MGNCCEAANSQIEDLIQINSLDTRCESLRQNHCIHSSLASDSNNQCALVILLI